MENFDIGIDLGTDSTIIYFGSKGIVLREPSVVAVDNSKKRVIAHGKEAQQMLGRAAPHISVIHPLRGGVISDYVLAEYMVRAYVRKVCGSRMLRPRIAISVPSGVTDVEARAVIEAAMGAGARHVFLVEEPLAAAIGAGVNTKRPVGTMVVDIGAGATNVAVVSLGGIALSDHCTTAGNTFDEKIMRYVERKSTLLISQREAEALKRSTASVFAPDPDAMGQVRGKNMVSGLPQEISVSQVELCRLLQDPVRDIVRVIRNVMELTPPELLADVQKHEILLTGGGSLLRGIDRLIAEELTVPVKVSSNPQDCVAIGAGRAFSLIYEGNRGLVDAQTYQHI